MMVMTVISPIILVFMIIMNVLLVSCIMISYSCGFLLLVCCFSYSSCDRFVVGIC